MARKVKIILTETDTGRSENYTLSVEEINNIFLKEGRNMVTDVVMALNESLNRHDDKNQVIVLPNAKVC